MTVHVDSITSEVVPERERGGEQPSDAGGSPELDAERWRALHERALRYAARTRAEAYDA